jgi:hypothetical protein
MPNVVGTFSLFLSSHTHLSLASLSLSLSLSLALSQIYGCRKDGVPKSMYCLFLASVQFLPVSLFRVGHTRVA